MGTGVCEYCVLKASAGSALATPLIKSVSKVLASPDNFAASSGSDPAITWGDGRALTPTAMAKLAERSPVRMVKTKGCIKCNSRYADGKVGRKKNE